MTGRPVSRAIRESVWRRVDSDIRKDIESGVLRPSDRLRAEKELAAAYGVGVAAVRQALRSLKADGLLISKPKSGVFVAERSERAQPRERAAGSGLHMFDIIHAAACRLRFTIVGWTPANRPVWERVCQEALSAAPSLAVEPVFPVTERDYAQACRSSDLFMTSMLDTAFLRGARGDTEWLAPDELADFPLPSRYADAVCVGGKAAGVPLSATLLVGGLNPKLVPPALQASLCATRSWAEALPLLANRAKQVSPAVGLNLNPSHTLNLFQYLTHVGGPLVDPATSRVLLDRADFRDALAALEAHRATLPVTQTDADHREPDACCAFLDITYQFHRHPEMLRLTPWLFPLGERGAYMENINVAVIARATPYPEECRRFLRHLLSASVQRRLTAAPGEHPVAADIPEPFAGYPEAWRRVLHAFRERSRLCGEHCPGYSEFLTTILLPLSSHFLKGEITAKTVITEAVIRGKNLFARQAQRPQPRVAGAARIRHDYLPAAV